MENRTVEQIVTEFIPNELGINLCAVDSISVGRQMDGQLTDIHIKFKPDNSEDKDIATD